MHGNNMDIKIVSCNNIADKKNEFLTKWKITKFQMNYIQQIIMMNISI